MWKMLHSIKYSVKFIFEKFSTVSSSVASIDVFYVTALYATSNMDYADRKSYTGSSGGQVTFKK